MRELIVSEHAIKRGQERIPSLEGLSVQTIKRWYKENVPFAKRIFLGSGLYHELEKVYNKGEYKPFTYLIDCFGIYIAEYVKNFNLYLHSVQDLNFRREIRLKLRELVGDGGLADLIYLRDSLRNQTNKQIENLIA